MKLGLNSWTPTSVGRSHFQRCLPDSVRYCRRSALKHFFHFGIFLALAILLSSFISDSGILAFIAFIFFAFGAYVTLSRFLLSVSRAKALVIANDRVFLRTSLFTSTSFDLDQLTTIETDIYSTTRDGQVIGSDQVLNFVLENGKRHSIDATDLEPGISQIELMIQARLVVPQRTT